MLFIVDDEWHAEPQGEFDSFENALAEVRRRASIPWDRNPNQAPCVGWKSCGRSYEIVKYDNLQSPWKDLERVPILEITAAGIKWASGFEGHITNTE
jgi:hypothetical protein